MKFGVKFEWLHDFSQITNELCKDFPNGASS